MESKSVIDSIFEQGISYSDYLGRSDRHRERMQKAKEATVNILETKRDILEMIDKPMNVVVFAENWCGDCANGVPVIAEIAERCQNWNFRIFPKDDYDELFGKYFTIAGKKKIPLLLFLDKENNEIARWVERPTEIYLLNHQMKKANLTREEKIQKLKYSPEFNPPYITELIVNEVLLTAQKAAAIVQSLM